MTSKMEGGCEMLPEMQHTTPEEEQEVRAWTPTFTEAEAYVLVNIFGYGSARIEGRFKLADEFLKVAIPATIIYNEDYRNLINKIQTVIRKFHALQEEAN